MMLTHALLRRSLIQLCVLQDIQAQDRTHHMSQMKEVQVSRLCTVNSVKVEARYIQGEYHYQNIWCEIDVKGP